MWEWNRFSSKPEDQQGAGGGAGGAAGTGGAAGENYEGDDETSIAEPAISCRRRSGRSSQIQVTITHTHTHTHTHTRVRVQHNIS